jgi:RNA 2',3'-cyclic 3'-phosphodiesterase
MHTTGPDQGSLFGFEPPPANTDRLFFALLPDEAAAGRIAALQSRLRAQFGLTGRSIATERLHVTLSHVGDHVGLPADIVEQAQRAGEAAAAAAPFELVFDRVASFARQRNLPFVMQGGERLDAVKAFQRQLVAAMVRAGLGRLADKSFTPHVTLMYDDRNVPETPVEPVSWIARELVLVRSLLGKTTHVPLARWPLSG